jgi:hypothetical protein
MRAFSQKDGIDVSWPCPAVKQHQVKHVQKRNDASTARKRSPPALPRRRTRQRQEAQRARRREQPHSLPPERGGPKGPEPTRYGDWEKKGLISDF